jgi:hypothetical protein
MSKISDRNKLGGVMWVLLIVGGIFLDKGNNGSNISVWQFWGAVLMVGVGSTIALFFVDNTEDKSTTSKYAYMKTQDFVDNYLKFVDHVRKIENDDIKERLKKQGY